MAGTLNRPSNIAGLRTWIRRQFFIGMGLFFVLFLPSCNSVDSLERDHIHDPLNPNHIPEPPVNLKAEIVSHNEAFLTWKSNNTPFAIFAIHREIAGSNPTLVDTVRAQVEQFTDHHEFDLNDTVRYLITAASTQEGGIATPWITYILVPPSIIVEHDTEHSIRIAWDIPSTLAEYVAVERATSTPNQFSEIARVTTGQHEYVDNSVQKGQQYYYRISAANERHSATGDHTGPFSFVSRLDTILSVEANIKHDSPAAFFTGDRIVHVDASENLRLVKIESGESTATINHSGGEIIEMAGSPDGHYLMVALRTGLVKKYNVASNLAISEFFLPLGFERVAFSPDASMIAVLGMDFAAVLETENGSVLHRFEGEDQYNVRAVRFDRQSERVGFVWFNRFIIADSRTGEIEWEEATPCPITSIDFSPDRRNVGFSSAVLCLFTGSRTDAYRLYDISSRQRVDTYSNSEHPHTQVAFHPLKPQVVLGPLGSRREIEILSVPAGEPITSIDLGFSSFRNLTFAPESNLLMANLVHKIVVFEERERWRVLK